MRRMFWIIASAVVFLGLIGNAWLISSVYFSTQYQPVHVIVETGSSAKEVAQRLTSSPLEKWVCYGLIVAQGKASRLRAGEYSFPAGLSRANMVQALTTGEHQVVYKLTIVEGSTVKTVLDQILAAPGLKGDVTQIPQEGELFPDTYHYQYGTKRQSLVTRMHQRMMSELEALWQSRAPDLPLHSPQELLTMASVIEKETSLPQERPQVAAVFYNRLKRGIPLQADPTVIYGLSQGVGRLERGLTREDLKVDHAHNTYVHAGLPVGPIALPGLGSLQAAAQPENSQALYFVADGTGKHVFSNDLTTHQKHHQHLRRLRRAKSLAK